MKFVVEYKIRRDGLTHKQADENFATLLKAFSRWQPEQGLKVHAFLSNAESLGGYVFVETDDVKAVASLTGKFSAWNDCKIVPVLDVAEGAALAHETLLWRAQALAGA